ncbi:serine hydrolase domain-containing protein [Streptomyces sp. KLOTTS4A1]|uniref:serine hydrolase domain-containing protein n=1 Tax=Streptomyces sp. KLOTTS4A1 TaxID=3390996 RepID=UPI0039F57021
MTSSGSSSDSAADRHALLDSTRRALDRRVALAQAQGRTPSVVAAVVRDGELVWEGAASSVDGHGPDGDVQYRIGSITKTFTAVLVLRLREEGLLELGDRIEQHLPGTGLGEVTVGQLLAHTSGLAAETPGAWWERTPGSERPTLGHVLGEAPFRHPVGRRHHYSNPGYTVLGALVENLRGAPWEDVLRREVLEPLGLSRTSAQPQAPSAGGWAVHPWADALLPERVEDLGLMAPAGQLWSTTRDLARFAVFLAQGDDRVLSAEAVREMREPAAPAEDGAGAGGYGLGLQLLRLGERSLAGHSGSLPGYLACLVFSVDEGLAAVTLTNCTSAPLMGPLATDLLHIVGEAEPRFPEPWRPMPEVDPRVLELAGPWYWGTSGFGLRVGADGIELGPLQGVGRSARFRAEEDGTWTGLNGYYAGETLRARRRPDGTLSHLDLGSFVFTREPYEEEAPVPGGVDPKGWRGLKQ